MSKDMWQDLFEIYQSVQSGDNSARDTAQAHDAPVAKATQQRTMYIFAYLDDGEGNTLRNMPVKDRMTMLELRQQEIHQRLQEIEDQLDELTDD